MNLWSIITGVLPQRNLAFLDTGEFVMQTPHINQWQPIWCPKTGPTSLPAITFPGLVRLWRKGHKEKELLFFACQRNWPDVRFPLWAVILCLVWHIHAVLENCNVPHTSYVSVSNAYLTNILFPVTIITSCQNFAVGVQIILGISEETNAHILHGSLPS